MCNKSHDFDAEARRSAGDGTRVYLLAAVRTVLHNQASAGRKDISIFKASLM